MLKLSASLPPSHTQTGFSMIEVLITIVIIAVGLLGLSGLQAKVNMMEMESYQRGQALALLQDMEDRLKASRGALDGPLTPVAAGGNAISTVVGPDGTTGYNPASAADCTGSGGQLQVCQWALAVTGSAEKIAGSKVGAMIGARGCVISIAPTQLKALAEYYLVILWQGLVTTADPGEESPAATCAATVNFGSGLRRAAVTRVLIPKLDS